MIIKQYYLGCLSQASYMIGDEETHSAVIVDPQRDVDRYIADAEQQGLKIKDIVLTHFHADFVAGHQELQKRTGATISLGVHAQAAYPFVARKEGDVLQYGQTRLVVMETPGHTPEGISLLAYDDSKDARHPVAVLTGDTLFVGDVGRPDLMASQGISATELAGELYHSLHDKLLTLPDDTVVYPAHGPGSLCGSGGSTATFSTIGQERRTNAALQPMPEDAFIRKVTSDLPDAPPYFARDAAINKSQHADLSQVLEREMKPLSVDQVVLLQNQGAQVVDVRDPDDFAAGHLTHSVNVGLHGRFAQWAGILLDPGRPIVLLAPAGYESEAAIRLGRVGLDQVAGFLQGGIEAARPDLISQTSRVSAQDLAAQLSSKSPPVVLDVRGAKEWQAGHIEGSLNVPLNTLETHRQQIPLDRPVVVHCESGYRSSMAISLLQQGGASGFTELTGGIAAWRDAGLPVHK